MNYKKDFPIFTQRPELVYLDNGASSQRCKAALDAVMGFYETSNSNIHRGPHFLAEEATIEYENARRTVADFLGAQESKEIIFTRNATEAINLVAHSFGETLQPGDIIVTTELEHHANIVPWLQLKERKEIEIRYIPITKDGFLDFDPSIIDEKVKLVAVSGMSNVLGTIINLEPIIKKAHEAGAKVLVDGSQLAVHKKVNVHEMGADFFVMTGHKLYGPTGIGVLYGKAEILENLPPFLGGGDMVQTVTKEGFIPQGLPERFEAGTPNIAGAIGLKAAMEYVMKIGWEKIEKTESELMQYLLDKIRELDFIEAVGPIENKNRGSILSFNITGIHPHDVAEGLSSKNICIRAGQHCAQPLLDACNLNATARISMAFYNDKQDIDKAIDALKEVYKYFNS